VNLLPESPKVDGKRTSPVQGDLRLLVTKAKGKSVAMLYRAVVSGTAEKDRVLFESPIGKVWFDRVDKVSGLLQLAQDGSNAEFSMPLSALSLSPKSGESVLADFGSPASASQLGSLDLSRLRFQIARA